LKRFSSVSDKCGVCCIYTFSTPWAREREIHI
jgi:hypothetical protein